MANTVNTKTQNKSIFKIISEQDRKLAIAEYENSTLWNKKSKSDVDFSSKFFTLKELKTLEKLLNIVYPKSNFSPSELQNSNSELINLGTIVKYYPRDLDHAKKQFLLAFVVREIKNLFKIFINEDCEAESFDSMDLHEKGHILFNHTQSVNLYIQEFREELEKIWDTKLTKFFAAEVKNNPNNKEKIVKILFKEFSNIAQDMEINSKLFDGGEWLKAKKTMARSGMIVHLKYLYTQIDDLSGLFTNQNIKDVSSPEYRKLLQIFEIIRQNITGRLNGEEGDFQFCFPGNKGWPLKLDWMTYMILLVKDIDETMQQVIASIKASLGQGQSQNGAGGNQPLSQDILDEYAQKQEDGEKASSSDGEGNEDGDLEDESDFETMGGQRSRGNRGRSSGHGGAQVEFETVSNFEDFTKFLRKTCIGKKNRKWNSDVLYNSNRGKFSSKVVVPRRHLIEKWMPIEITVLIDVSGSVNTDLVEAAINSILSSASGVDIRHSHIVFCDTRVIHDEIMSERTKKVYSGGGTEMANGIKYILNKGYCKKRSDMFFLISDLQDELQSWITEGNKLHCRKFIIGYGYSSKERSRQVFDTSSKFITDWNSCWEKTVFIMS